MDSGPQADKAWLLSVQKKLYQWSWEHPGETYRDVWNWVTDSRNLRCAWRVIASNKGKRTPGIDGETVESLVNDKGTDTFLEEVREELRTGSYRPSPARRKWIPKRGKAGKFRPLGIPTVKGRVVQCAVKNILEPIFEARFWHVSYGFRPGRGCQGALEHIRQTIRPRRTDPMDGKRHSAPYQWVIEGDIEGCFDQIDHHLLMNRVRQSVADKKVNRLIVSFLKAGVMLNVEYRPTRAGTPQGGITSGSERGRRKPTAVNAARRLRPTLLQGDAALGRMLICHELMKEAGEILEEARKPIDHEVATGALTGLALNHYKHCGSSRMIGVALGVHLFSETSPKTH